MNKFQFSKNVFAVKFTVVLFIGLFFLFAGSKTVEAKPTFRGHVYVQYPDGTRLPVEGVRVYNTVRQGTTCGESCNWSESDCCGGGRCDVCRHRHTGPLGGFDFPQHEDFACCGSNCANCGSLQKIGLCVGQAMTPPGYGTGHWEVDSYNTNYGALVGGNTCVSWNRCGMEQDEDNLFANFVYYLDDDPVCVAPSGADVNFNPASMTVGNTTTLSWNVANLGDPPVTSCTLTTTGLGGFSSNQCSGSQSFSPGVGTYTANLTTPDNGCGTSSDTANLVVTSNNSPPTVSISEVPEGCPEYYTFNIHASDPNGNADLAWIRLSLDYNIGGTTPCNGKAYVYIQNARNPDGSYRPTDAVTIFNTGGRTDQGHISSCDLPLMKTNVVSVTEPNSTDVVVGVSVWDLRLLANYGPIHVGVQASDTKLASSGWYEYYPNFDVEGGLLTSGSINFDGVESREIDLGNSSTLSWDGSGTGAVSGELRCYYRLTNTDPWIVDSSLGVFCGTNDIQSIETVTPVKSGEFKAELFLQNECGEESSEAILIVNESLPSSKWMMTSWGDTFASEGYSITMVDADPNPGDSTIYYGSFPRTEWLSNGNPEYFSNYIESAGSGTLVNSRRWSLNPYSDANVNRWFGDDGLYTLFRDLAAKNGETPEAVDIISTALNTSGAWEVPASSITGVDECAANVNSVIFVNGNLTIDPGEGDDLGLGKLNQDSACIFIVSGNITIGGGDSPVDDPNYDIINGFFITDGSFTTSENSGEGLFINGGVISSTVAFGRTTQAENLPAEAIRYDPRYFELLRDVLGQDYSYNVRETGY